jgi:hypothetical protein
MRSGLPASSSTALPASFLATYRPDTLIRRSSVMPTTPRSNSAWWSDLEAVPEPASGESRLADYSPFGRVVFPVALLDSGDFRQP